MYMLWDLFPLMVIVGGGLTLWNLHRRLQRAEFELAGLRDLFLALRSHLETLPKAQSAGAPAAAPVVVAPAAAAPAAAAEMPSSTVPASPAAPDVKASPAAHALPEEPVQAARPVAPAMPARPSVPTAGNRDLETALGTRWAVWVGGLALALGGVFLVRYSIEAGLLGPGTRLALGGLFGLALLAGGEAARRTGYSVAAAGAHLPGILTAAGAFTLFAVIYAAHGLYGFIGPAAAFALLAAIGLATMAAALVHGQALAGIGLVGAYAAPLLVASTAPNAWALFIEVAVALAGAAFIARRRRWLPLMLAAAIGAGLWLLLYLADGAGDGIAAAGFIGLVLVAVLAALWLRGRRAAGEARLAGLADPVGLATAVPVGLAALAVGSDSGLAALAGAPLTAAALIVALVAAAAWRADAMAGLAAAATAATLLAVRAVIGDESALLVLLSGPDVAISFVATLTRGSFLQMALPAGLALFAGGLWGAFRFAAAPRRAALWAGASASSPTAIVVADWLAYGDPGIDLAHALALALLGAALAAAGESLGRRAGRHDGAPVAVLWAGSALAIVAALHAGFGPATTTMLLAAVAAGVAAAWTWRPVAIITWIAAALSALLLARIVVDPALIDGLSATPVFNYMLPGYFLPAAAFALAAWWLAGTPRGSPMLVTQAMAALLALVGTAMLVRHAIHGGVLDASEPRLSEVAIDTLVAIGGGAILVALDRRAASPVFRLGSIGLGLASVAAIVIGHGLTLNPLVTNAATGAWPVINQLLLAYLLPGLGLGLLALFARPYRPLWWVRLLTAAAALMVFLYATLSVRRWFKGEFIGSWKGLEPLETWSYSALWLALGVAVLVLGLRFNSLVLRFASAALVVLAVAKVFLFDMAELEGPLRAFSFIALGLVLIGIGLFYQRMLMRRGPDAGA